MNELDLPEDLVRELTVRAKKQIRARMKALRGSFPKSALAERSRKVVENLLRTSEVAEARGVALFWPLEEKGEIDLRDLDQELRLRGTRVFYPFQEPNERGYRTGFRESKLFGDVIHRGQRFAEPPLDAALAERGEVDLVLVPGLAGDGRGHRIGYGAGYYDATLGDLCPPAKACLVLYDFQLLAELPSEEHDRACDFIATDARLLRF